MKYFIVFFHPYIICIQGKSKPIFLDFRTEPVRIVKWKR
jgi:hypothetical protein